ncbi:MAG: aldolase/citrate lyase family protein [Pirellulaceae bacterium]|nr:aldolase/citrate lyase family protein [Pirellulaceae bacterium]
MRHDVANQPTNQFHYQLEQTTSMINRLRNELPDGPAKFGMWVSLESPNVSEAAMRLGVDWLLIDMEHGHLGWKDVANHLRVINANRIPALIRIPDLCREAIQRALDIGADGIVVPMISHRDQLELAFRYGKYPPRGARGLGGERCVKWGLETLAYVQDANSQTLVIPLLETREAVENFDQILQVPGLDGIWFGPSDMSSSYGFLGQWEGGPVAEHVVRMCQTAAAQGIASGILARDANEIELRRRQGFQWITLGADINLMLGSLKQQLEAAKQTRV